ncbi:MAG: hypothetical protein ABIT83_06195, partial [Massilia sp.]
MKLNLPIRTVQLAAAAFLVLLGLTVIVRWIFQLGAIDALLPEAARMGLNTPMMLLACGVALSLTGVPVRAAPWRGRVRNACLAAAGLLAALLLLETLTGVAFGIDFVRTPIAPSALTPHPGRPAPNTCLCVLLAVGSLLIANRPRLTPRLDLVRQVLAALLCAIAFSALIGHMLNLSALYRVATFNTMLATSATALCVLGAALFAIPLERPWLRGAVHTSIGNLSRKVNSSISTVLLLVAAGTGLAGFSTMREGLQQSVRDNMLLTTTTNATALATGLESRLLLPAAMAARSSVEQPLARLAMRRDDAQALAALAAVGKNMLDAGMSEVRFEAADGSPISVAGKSGPAAGATRLPLRTEGANAALVWRD